MSDITHPPHYMRTEIQPLEYAEAQGWGEGFCHGNVNKYHTRAGHKGKKLEDLQKARFYICRLIEYEVTNGNPCRPFEMAEKYGL